MTPGRKEKPAMVRKTLIRMSVAAAALVATLASAQAQDEEEPP